MSDRAPRRSLATREWFPWLVVALAFAGQGAGATTAQGLSTLYVFIQGELSLTRGQVGLITASLFGAGTTTALLSGWALDRYGVRRMFPLMLAVISVGFLALTQARSLAHILLVAGAIGVMFTLNNPAGTKAVMEWVPSRVRGMAMSVKQAAVPAGGVASAAVLPVVALAVGWRSAAALLAVGTLTAAVLIAVLYRDRPADDKHRAASRSFSTGLRAVLSNRRLVMASVLFLVLAGLYLTLITYLIIFLVEAVAFSIPLAGVALAVFQGASVAARVGWGALSDGPFGGRRAPVVALVLALSSLLLLATSTLSASTARWLVWAVVAALGLTAASWQGVFNAMLGEMAGPGLTGTALGLAGLGSRLGVVVLPPLFGSIVDHAGGDYRTAWLGAAALMGLSALGVAALLRGSAPPSSRDPDALPTSLAPAFAPARTARSPGEPPGANATTPN